MAGNKINTKKKDEKTKSSRNPSQASDETEDLDFSLLRKPILTSITGFAQARKIFDVATEELKGLINNECDLLYECKVCRNIFRSLVNYVSHKRIYCREKFNTSLHGHFIRATSSYNELLKIKQLEESYQESLKEVSKPTTLEAKEVDERIPLTKDLSAVIERIAVTKGIQQNQLENQQVTLQKIPKSSVAVFQNLTLHNDKNDSMREQVMEINDMSSRNKAVLQSDGQFIIQNENKVPTDTDNVIQISDDDENETANVLKCKICDLQFSTQKTLKVHMKYKHLESRLVYPCPDCMEIFSTSWSVYRHLFKVHRKTAAQIRRLRESVQSKAFRMNNPPAFYEKRKMYLKNVSTQKKTEEERLEQENQAWMEDMEGDGEVPRCGGCGRTFERRAALSAHTHTCQPRSRALARRPLENKKIEIQIRKDYHKGPASVNNTNSSITPISTNVSNVTDPNAPNEISTTNENNANSPLKSAEAGDNKTKTVVCKSKTPTKDDDGDANVNELTKSPMDVIEEDTKQLGEVGCVDRIVENNTHEDKFKNKLPFAYQAEKSNLQALRQKMLQDVELEKLQCKKCENKCNDVQELLDHMATHYKWLRYGCKLCNFKHYSFDKLPEHVKIVHKLKGDSDFYFSTLKAIDGVEALELSESTEEMNYGNETSPDSRRPSRCSSDSSRLSDDSSSSSTRMEVGSRKRKANIVKNNPKRKKEIFNYDNGDDQKDDVQTQKSVIENDSSSNSKVFEENSSDIDDSDDKTLKRQVFEISSVASRRPVRKKTKRKNEDFEYDLSNLLKMEAQGYRDSQTISKNTNQSKKKLQQDTQFNYDIINKDCCGALSTMSRKTAENSKAFMKTSSFTVYNSFKGSRISNIFARPSIPKGLKICPLKEPGGDVNVASSPSKEQKPIESKSSNNTIKEEISEQSVNENQIIQNDESLSKTDPLVNNDDLKKNLQDNVKEQTDTELTSLEKDKVNSTGNSYKPFSINFRQGLEVIKNPLVKKNLTDFSKAGMKTKILVIKPINRSKDGSQALNTPLKFQTIKLKDPNQGLTANKEKKSDQVMVVPVPKVDRPIGRTVPTFSVASSSKPSESDTKPVDIDENEDSKSATVDKITANEQIEEETDKKPLSDSAVDS